MYASGATIIDHYRYPIAGRAGRPADSRALVNHRVNDSRAKNAVDAVRVLLSSAEDNAPQ
jgi:hypothetical protein